MEVAYEDGDLDRLEADREFSAGLPPEAVRGFRKVIQQVRAARDTRDLGALRGLRFEKLKGARGERYSLRLNKQWRLIVTPIEGSDPPALSVVEIVDYH